MKKRIICVGNRYVSDDDTGPRVYDYLMKMSVPTGIQVIEGGLAGLGMLEYIEDAERVVFVDAVKGFGSQGQIVVLDGQTVEKTSVAHYGHSNGLAYLLKVLPEVCDGEVPEILLVGVEGVVDELTIKVIADTSVRIVEAGLSTEKYR